MTYEDRIAQIVDRAIEKKHMTLAELIESENMQIYEPGTLTIMEGDELGMAFVPCRGFMILTRDRYDEEKKEIVAEYAIYSEHDNDGLEPLYNSMNANATYRLVTVSEDTYENMAFAISAAVEEIKKATD